MTLYNVLPPPFVALKFIDYVSIYLLLTLEQYFMPSVFFFRLSVCLSVCLLFPLSLVTRDPISLHNLTTILCNLKCVLLHVIMRKRQLFLFSL